jgi:hypothetical protein
VKQWDKKGVETMLQSEAIKTIAEILSHVIDDIDGGEAYAENLHQLVEQPGSFAEKFLPPEI